MRLDLLLLTLISQLPNSNVIRAEEEGGCSIRGYSCSGLLLTSVPMFIITGGCTGIALQSVKHSSRFETMTRFGEVLSSTGKLLCTFNALSE